MTRTMRRTMILLVAMLMAITACAGGGEDAATDVTLAEASGLVTTQGGEAAEEEFAASDDAGALRDLTVDVGFGDSRRVIRHARLELHAADTRSAYEDIVALVESVGGFVADATVFPTSSEEEQPQVSLTLRVPVDALNATMTAIKESADKVVSESQGAEDVTDQFVDLEARLTNLEALEVELRALLEEVRKQENADPEKLLRVFNELSSVRGQIEQIQGQLEYLNDLTELATLGVEITQTPTAVPIVDEPWSPAEAARDAVRDLVAGLQDAADWAIGFALYGLPILILVAGPLLLIAVFVYRRLFRSQRTT